MLISLNWLKKYVNITISDDELVRLIGARLVEVEGVIDETSKYDNIYVVEVSACEKIEGTHLSLCKINNGAEEIQVVCGAPNVHTGMLAAWIAPGAIVPVSVHEDAPFVIGKRKMLGKYDSFGMLAGADELDFGDDHSGIVEIDPATAKPGDKLAEVFDLNDKILEIENKSLTHRPDCFGLIGFAREVAGILGVKFDSDLNFCFSETVSREPYEASEVSETRNGGLEQTRSKKDWIDVLKEGRILTLEFPNFYLVNVYTPNSKPDLSRLTLREQTWDPAFLTCLKQLEQTKPVITCGDFNAAHTEIDLARPKTNHHSAGFTDAERQGITNILNAGFIDTFRSTHPDTKRYTWWSHWAHARENNVGWRIDYFFISSSLKPQLHSAEIYEHYFGSDHCPISIEMEF